MILSFLLLASSAAGLLAVEKAQLSVRVVWNNPFNPSGGEVTRFEYFVRGEEAPLRLSVHASDGHLVRQLADRLASADVLYVETWDGRNDDGNLVDSGLYFVVLRSDSARTITRVAVKRQ